MNIASVRHALAMAISLVVAFVTACFAYVALVALVQLAIAIPQQMRLDAAYQRGAISWQEYLLAGAYRTNSSVAVLLYIGFYVLPFIVALPIAAPVVLLWAEPARMLFLRPFNRQPLTRGLTRVVRRDAARFGHVYTLADADLRVRWYVRVPALLGQIALLSFRTRKITRASRLPRLERAINRTWLRNINWCLSWRKVFPVASADSCWQEVVERLVRRCSVIFIDLTEARPNVRWEIDLIHRLGLESRVMWLLALDAATPEVSRLVQPSTAETIFRYDKSGVVDRAAFRKTLADRLSGARETSTGRASGALSIAALVMFSVGCFPLLGLWLPGTSDQIANLGDLRVGILCFGLLTLATLAFARIRNRNAIFLITVQAVLLLGALFGPLPLGLV